MPASRPRLGVDSGLGLGVVYIAPLAGEDPAVLAWALANLGAPNGIHLPSTSAEGFNPAGSEGFILPVDAWRLRPRNPTTGEWCRHVVLAPGTMPGLRAANPVVDGPALPLRTPSISPRPTSPRRSLEPAARPSTDGEPIGDRTMRQLR